MKTLHLLNRIRSINIDNGCVWLCDGDLHLAYLLSYLVDRYEQNGEQPIAFKMGRFKTDNTDTLCGMLHLNYHGVQKILKLVATRLSNKNKTSNSIIEYWLGEMGILWFRLNLINLDRVANKKHLNAYLLGLENAISPLNSKPLNSNLPLNSKPLNSSNLKPLNLGGEENKKDSDVQPSLRILYKKDIHPHSSDRIILKEKDIEKSPPRNDGLLNATPIKLQEHPSWSTIKDFLDDWINKINSKSIKNKIDVHSIRSTGKQILSWLDNAVPAEAITDQIVWATNNGRNVVTKPNPRFYRDGDGAARLAGNAGPGKGDVMHLFAHVTAEKPYPFICGGDIKYIDDIIIQIEDSHGHRNPAYRAPFRAWLWVCLEFIEFLFHNTYGWTNELEDDSEYIRMPSNATEEFVAAVSNYWRWHPVHGDAGKTKERAIGFIRDFIFERTDLLSFDKLSLKMFHAKAKITEDVFNELDGLSYATFPELNIEDFFEDRLNALRSGEYKKDYIEFIQDGKDQIHGD